MAIHLAVFPFTVVSAPGLAALSPGTHAPRAWRQHAPCNPFCAAANAVHGGSWITQHILDLNCSWLQLDTTHAHNHANESRADLVAIVPDHLRCLKIWTAAVQAWNGPVRSCRELHHSHRTGITPHGKNGRTLNVAPRLSAVCSASLRSTSGRATTEHSTSTP